MELFEALGLIASILALLLLFRYADRRNKRHEESKLTAVHPSAGEPIQLRFAPTGPGAAVAYLRYEIEFEGTEDDFGLRCQVEARQRDEVIFSRDLSILGAISNPPPMDFDEKVRSQYNVRLVSGGIGYRRWATVELGIIEEPAPEVTLSGTITSNKLTRIKALEVYLVPLEMKL